MRSQPPCKLSGTTAEIERAVSPLRQIKESLEEAIRVVCSMNIGTDHVGICELDPGHSPAVMCLCLPGHLAPLGSFWRRLTHGRQPGATYVRTNRSALGGKRTFVSTAWITDGIALMS